MDFLKIALACDVTEGQPSNSSMYKVYSANRKCIIRVRFTVRYPFDGV
jgi:hypothetical protein